MPHLGAWDSTVRLFFSRPLLVGKYEFGLELMAHIACSPLLRGLEVPGGCSMGTSITKASQRMLKGPKADESDASPRLRNRERKWHPRLPQKIPAALSRRGRECDERQAAERAQISGDFISNACTAGAWNPGGKTG